MLPGDLRAYALMGRMIGAGMWMLAGALAGVIGLLAWQARQPALLPGVVTLATPAKVMTKVERVTVPCTTVQAYATPAKKKLKLPASVQANPNSHVLASSDVQASERDTRISTVLDTDTGAVDTYSEALPLPWLRPESRGELGAYYGVKSGHFGPMGRLVASYDLLQIKSSHIGVMGSLDTDGAAFAGVGVKIRW